MPKKLAKMYRDVKKASAQDLRADGVNDLLLEMAAYARGLLQNAEPIELISRVQGKQYFGFKAEVQSRPINQTLFAETNDVFNEMLQSFDSGFKGTEPANIARATYTIAYSVFAANDIYNVGRKASATFFEVLIGHIVARAVGVSPRKKVQIPESGADLPTDYVFDPGPKSRKIHLPLKTSTRERGVQAWVHQLVLDRIFGNGVYRGIFVVGSETKRNVKTGEVIEICVPKQFQMFQARVAEITKIYYLDPPQIYLALADSFPRVDVRSFGDALGEIGALLRY
jgi:hypothetical protein